MRETAKRTDSCILQVYRISLAFPADHNTMDSVSVDRNSSTSAPPGEDIVEPVTSTTPMENDNVANVGESNSNNSNTNHNLANSNARNSRCLEPAARMILPPRP